MLCCIIVYTEKYDVWLERLGVKSRQIMYLADKPLRLLFAPCPERLEGAEVAEGALRDLPVVKREVVAEAGGKLGGGAEAGGEEFQP
ncbi:hypothetical protein ANRL3_00075 [Anaerolineae bacterium]|nr:hypothetical protein ANRL3_00075 [Anaerolineae bacterium]